MSENGNNHVGESSPRPTGTALRGYLVTVIGRATRAYNLSEPPESLPYGVRVELEENGIVLRIPVAAVDAASALADGRSLAEDFFRVLGSSHAPYLLDLLDKRDHITRTDAVYIADGPVPAVDIAEGGISEAGLQLLDPDGEGRRAGKIIRIRAAGVVTHPITADAVRFGRRDHWSPQLRSGLSLYWAGQCSPDPQVCFVLSMAALEVLAGRNTDTLLKLRLNNAQRDGLRKAIEAVLRLRDELSTTDVQRLTARLMDTQAVGAVPGLTQYLNNLIPDGGGDLTGGVSEDEVRAWQGQRGAYLHTGPLNDTEAAALRRLVTFVGEALRRELDKVPAEATQSTWASSLTSRNSSVTLKVSRRTITVEPLA